MSKVFIARIPQDAELADRLTEYLTEAGHEVLSPGTETLLGSVLSDSVHRCIAEADVVVFLLSEYATRSGFFQHELGYAIGAHGSTGRSAILPVKLVEVTLPQDLRSTAFVNAVGRPEAEVFQQIDRIVGQIVATHSAARAKRVEIQSRVESTAEDFIHSSLQGLTRRENRYRRISYVLYAVSYLTLISGVYLVVSRFTPTGDQATDWPRLIQHTFLLSVVLAFVVAASKFAFTLAKSFMVESLRNADRIHAIKFGEFYLKAFGDQAQWSQMKEAFQHWNIDSGSDFIRQDVKHIDPEIHEKILELIKTVKKA